ncbi:unnamed protein product [Schistosoma rodhaini]|uniref:Kinesin-like protein n=1 Tax=Schistosoma rodhaini TaxID=6188 RepID=A0AA85G4V6_9TREM|nr:unnamed protein product [Schistosoma rodhaini]CAH8600913.1 unnamed protein product [Schistosoma rodhaini]
MDSEAVKVIVRARPLNEREQLLKCDNILEVISDTGQCSIACPNDKKRPPKVFFFDGSYDENSTTEQIYNDACYSLVEGVTEGYNGTIFAYGQTGCGKSYTMQGVVEPPFQKGVIPRAFDQIFETMSVSEKTKYLVHASFLEIYNEEIRDLLGHDYKAKLELKENPDKGVYVAGLSMHKITSVAECQNIMERGWKNRSTGATLMNADSSRSHSIFTIYLEMIDRSDNSLDYNHIRAGKLNLVDLAGSERQTKTGATGDRFKEATKINLSLSALGNVISALVDSKVKHIPYRDSKLTRLLQDSLGGNTKTLMIACLSPADNNYDETLSTLRYANRAKNIRNKPKINEDPKDALLRQYQEEIKYLKELLNNMQLTTGNVKYFNGQENIEIEDTETEKEKLRKDYELKLLATKAQYSAETVDKVDMLKDITHLKELYDAKLVQLNSHQDLLSSTNQPPHITELDQMEELSEISDDKTQQQIVSQNDTNLRIDTYDGEITKDELLQRLKLLEADIVGGEQAGNKEVNEKISRRKKYAEERKRRLMEANADLEDDGIMINIYETIQDELYYKNKALQSQKQKVHELQMEIKDVQSEFEQDRSDHLETIRRQEQQINLLNMILEKVQPFIRRDSNYYNIDKIKRTAKFDAEKNEWILPQMVIEHTQLPSANLNNSSNRYDSNYETTDGNAECDVIKDLKWASKKESRLYAKLDDRIQSNYFSSRRADQILRNAARSESERYRSSNHTARLNNFSCKLTTGNTESTLLSSCEVKSSMDTYLHYPDVRKKPMKLNPMSEFALNSTHVYGQKSFEKVKWHSKM